MITNPKYQIINEPANNQLQRIRKNIANSMVGRAVNLLVGSERTARGVVTAVDLQTGVPKIVVSGLRYDLRQVLAVMPAGFGG